MKLPRRLRRLVDELELLLEGRLVLFLVGDFLALTWGFLMALFSGGKFADIYSACVILPMVLLLVPALSALIALERRAGSLDLALAAPSPPLLFLGRAAAPWALALLQGWAVLLIAFLERHPWREIVAGQAGGWGELLRALFSSALVASVVAAVALFWATRLRSGGAVLTVTASCLLPFAPFLLVSPKLPDPALFPKSIFETYAHLADWSWSMLVLMVTALLFFLAGLDRLRRPELLS